MTVQYNKSGSQSIRNLFALAAATMLVGCASIRPPSETRTDFDPVASKKLAANLDQITASAQQTAQITVSYVTAEQQKIVDAAIAESGIVVATAKLRQQVDVVTAICEKAANENADPMKSMCAKAVQAFSIENSGKDIPAAFKPLADAGTTIANGTHPDDVRCQSKDNILTCVELPIARKEEAPVIKKVAANDDKVDAKPPRKERKPATQIVNEALAKARNAAPDVAVAAVGAAANVAVKKGLMSVIGAKFAMAAAATTLPHVLGAVAVAAAVGVVAGGLVGGITAVVREGMHRDGNINYRTRDGYPSRDAWKKEAFIRGAKRGALFGALGGAAGELIANAVNSSGFIHNLFSHSSAPVQATHVASGVTHQAASQTAETVAAAAPAPETLSNGVKALLSETQMKGLPEAVQKLAESQKPEDVVKFCKEASFALINQSHQNADAVKAGYGLIKHGLDVAKESGLHNSVVRMLNRDSAYMKTAHMFKNIASAFKPA